MLISLVIPVCEAQATLPRAIRSLLAQTWQDWEAVVVIDDGADYAAVLRAQGIGDARIRYVSTGKYRSGCHRARNVGLAAVRGDLVGALDADDVFHPRRLAVLAPIAEREGAAADNLAVIDDADGSLMYRVMGDPAAPVVLGIAAFLDLSAPLVPLIRREHALPRTEGVEYAEDVIGNLCLIDRIGKLVVQPETLYDYRIRAGSIANADDAGAEFEQAYTDYIARLQTGDGFGIAPANRAEAAAGIIRKRALNRRFSEAFRTDRRLNFQSFVAGTKR